MFYGGYAQYTDLHEEGPPGDEGRHRRRRPGSSQVRESDEPADGTDTISDSYRHK